MTFGFIAATVSAVGGAATATTTTASGDLTGAIPSVVTSSAQNGSELFEVNLRDDRYLPYREGGGDQHVAVGPAIRNRPVRLRGIPAVILQMRYSAREAGQLGDAAVDYLRDEVLGDPENLLQLFASTTASATRGTRSPPRRPTTPAA